MAHRDAAKHKYTSILHHLLEQASKSGIETSMIQILDKTKTIRDDISKHYQLPTDYAFNNQEREWLVEKLTWESYFPTSESYYCIARSSTSTTPSSSNSTSTTSSPPPSSSPSPPLFPGRRPLNPIHQPLTPSAKLPKCQTCPAGSEVACPMVKMEKCASKGGKDVARRDRHGDFMVRYGTESFKGPGCPRCFEDMMKDSREGWVFC